MESVKYATFVVLAPCTNYTSLTDGDRSTGYVTIVGGAWKCDDQLVPGWYRFSGAAGTKMSTICPSGNICATRAVSWLDPAVGDHPAASDGVVSRTIFFSYASNCTRFSVPALIQNCGSFYVYRLQATPYCSLRYCATL